jgi:hypothetical protein
MGTLPYFRAAEIGKRPHFLEKYNCTRMFISLESIRPAGTIINISLLQRRNGPRPNQARDSAFYVLENNRDREAGIRSRNGFCKPE